MPAPITTNTLFYGDNLPILREYVTDASVDLVYLDPPFNSNRTYNVLFRQEGGAESEAQIAAFEDTWHWNRAAERTYYELLENAPPHVSQMIDALHGFIGRNQMMAYLVMMAARLVELHRVLKPTGSLYLHCDPTASHYLRVVLDTVFGVEHFRNQIIWQRSDTHNDATYQFPFISDHILFYTKGKKYTFNPMHAPHAERTLQDWYQYLELPDGTVRRMSAEERESQIIPEGARRFNAGDMASPNPRPNLMYDYKGYPYPPKGWRYSKETMQELDKKGLLLFPSSSTGRIMRKRYLDEQKGAVIGDTWTDISQLRGVDAERLGYPTQKPLALLERIISAGSNEGDVVLDPFCGCGTTIAAAQKLGRRWIGIDVTHLSIALQKYRLTQMFPDAAFAVIGEPTTEQGARQLARDDRFQFQWWALSLIRARPYGGDAGSKKGKKGADRGIDGLITFIDEAGGKAKRVIVQVKSGKVKSGDIRDLVGTVEREGAALGVFLSLEPPTAEMTREAVAAGFYQSPGWGTTHPRLQILTVGDLLAGRARVDMPPTERTFKAAGRVKDDGGAGQPGLFD